MKKYKEVQVSLQETFLHKNRQRSSSIVPSPWYRVVRCVSREDKPYKEHSLRRTGLRACGVSSSFKIASLNLFNTVHWDIKRKLRISYQSPWELIYFMQIKLGP